MTRRLLTALAIVSMFASVPLLAGEGEGGRRGLRAKAAAKLEIGSKIPAGVAKLKMKGTDDKEYSIESVAGKHGTLVIFSCNHCPWVVKWEARIAKICNEYRKLGFGVIVINSNGAAAFKQKDGLPAMAKRAKERGFEFPYVSDPTSAVARAFNAKKTPEVFLFDAEKALVYTGAIDDNANDAAAVENPYLINALKATKAGTEVIMKRSKGPGCSIKFAPKPKETEGT